MSSSILLSWTGALLIICGVLYGAAQALWGGRLSNAKLSSSTKMEGSLEPRHSTKSFSFKTHWPAFALVLLGGILILAEGVF